MGHELQGSAVLGESCDQCRRNRVPYSSDACPAHPGHRLHRNPTESQCKSHGRMATPNVVVLRAHIPKLKGIANDKSKQSDFLIISYRHLFSLLTALPCFLFQGCRLCYQVPGIRFTFAGRLPKENIGNHMILGSILAGSVRFLIRMGCKWDGIDGEGHTKTTYISKLHPHMQNTDFRCCFALFVCFTCFGTTTVFRKFYSINLQGV